MKHGFTLIELILVILVVSILAVTAYEKIGGESKIQEATDQVIRHIRYTQHLAMVDDKYTARPNGTYSNLAQDRKNAQLWFKKYWQIRFHSSNFGSTSTIWSYSIFTDKPSSGNNNEYNGQPNKTTNEVAINPLQPDKILTGGFNNGLLPYWDSVVTKEMTLGLEYIITNIATSGGCSSTKAISFDSLGRPYSTFGDSDTTQYDNLLKSQCRITLSDSYGQTATICVEPITGYSHKCQ